MQEAQFLDTFAVGMDVERALRMLETLSHGPMDKEILSRALHALREHLLAHFTMEEETLLQGIEQVPHSTREGHELLEKQILEHQRIRSLYGETERLIRTGNKSRSLSLSVTALANAIRAHLNEEQEAIGKVASHMQTENEKVFREMYYRMHEEI